jgi:hypothetical protein
MTWRRDSQVEKFSRFVVLAEVMRLESKKVVRV